MKSKYLDIKELVPPDIYTVRGDAAWELIDHSLIILLDNIWANIGEFEVNNWHRGGQYKESGFRSASSTVDARYSQHKFGRAADCKPKLGSAQDFYAKILSDKLLPSKSIWSLTLEDIAATGPGGWVHIDVRNNSSPGIRIIKP